MLLTPLPTYHAIHELRHTPSRRRRDSRAPCHAMLEMPGNSYYATRYFATTPLMLLFAGIRRHFAITHIHTAVMLHTLTPYTPHYMPLAWYVTRQRS